MLAIVLHRHLSKDVVHDAIIDAFEREVPEQWRHLIPKQLVVPHNARLLKTLAAMPPLAIQPKPGHSEFPQGDLRARCNRALDFFLAAKPMLLRFLDSARLRQ